MPRPLHLPPAPLVVAASLTAVEGLLVAGLGLVELASLNKGRVTMGATTGVFFVLYAAGLLFCAWQLTREVAWVRSPVVLAQLIQLGLAWNFLGGDTRVVGIALAVVAVVVLAGLFHPASMRALER